MEAGALVARERLQRRGVQLEWFTVAWNVAEALVAIAAGVAAGSIALIGFGVDSGIEVVAASALLWRFRQAKADASEAEHDRAEQRALYVVSATFFALALYIAFEAIQSLSSSDEPENAARSRWPAFRWQLMHETRLPVSFGASCGVLVKMR